MKKLLGNKNLLLVIVLLVTLLFSSLATIRRLETQSVSVTLPVAQTTSDAMNAIESFKKERDETAAADMAVLQQLTENESVDASTKENAATQLQEMIDRRERQTALEGVLIKSGIYPCVVVITGTNATIVTEKTALTDGERALILTLSETHAGIAPSGVRVITGKEAN